VIVKVADLGDEVRRVAFSETPEALNALLAAAPAVCEQRFELPVTVESEVYRPGTDVFFVGKLRCGLVSTCRRCAEEFSEPLLRDFKFLIVKGGDAEDDELEDDTGLDHYQGDEVDLSPLVSEQALLALEGSPLCTETCKGLCAGCGVNLNKEACTCS
jgi:uncharacterized protein